MRRIVIASLLFTSISAAQAATITLNDLPTEVQGCHASGSCFVDMDSAADFQGMSAHRYFNFDLNTDILFDGWLIRYGLVAPSGIASTGYFLPVVGELQSPVTMVTPYSGNVWLQASNTYSLSDQYHQFTLFANGGSATLGLTTTDLQTGGGFVRWSGEPDYAVDGSLQRSPIATCVECGWATNFNLVFLNYSTGTLNFNPSDHRSLLFSESTWLSGYGSLDYSVQNQLYVQSVPLPAALPLLGTGLALLTASGLRRRKQN